MNVLCRRIEDTERLGAALASSLIAGDVLLLEGPMGAGKSVLARAIIRALGEEGPVPSPTFTLMNAYQTKRLLVCHFDLYRLADAEELYAAGLEEFLPPEGGVALVEWPGQALEAMPKDALRISIQQAAPEARSLELRPVGRFTEALLEGIVREAKV